jgi:ATP-binding cassette, subfamily B, bacterial
VNVRLPLFRREQLAAALRVYRTFAPDVRKERLRLFLALLAVLGGIGAVLAGPWPVKFLIDALTLDAEARARHLPAWLLGLSPAAFIAATALAVLAIALLGAGCQSAQAILSATAGQRIAYRIRRRLYGHLLRLPLSFHETSRTGDLLMRVTGDVQALKEMLVPSVLDLAEHGALLVGMVAVLLFYSPPLAGIALAVVPLLALATVRFGARLRAAVRETRRREGETASVAAESLASVALVQAFAREEYAAEIFASRNRKSLKAGLKSTRLEAGLQRVVEVVTGLGTAAVLAFGAREVLQGRLTGGDLFVVVAYVRSFYRPLRQAVRSLARVAKASACGERILEVLAREPEIRDLPGAEPAPRLRGEIRFEGVSLVYPNGRRALDAIQLAVAAGEKVAIVGPSGSGKSSLVSLIPRLREPSEGVVRVDGRDLRQLTLESLRSQVTLVLQESVLFGMTVRENLLFGRPEATPEEMLAAARRAGAHGFVGRLPHGFETRLGERGATLSGGERQRLALARAALRDAPIVVLDEPFTGLDAATEEAVSRDLLALFEGRTLLLIAHRFAGLPAFDRVVVLDGGRLVAEGKHADLLRDCDLYRSLAIASERPALDPAGAQA